METLNDILEELADKLGIYGACTYVTPREECKDCRCRVGFMVDMRNRIELAVNMERLLFNVILKPEES